MLFFLLPFLLGPVLQLAYALQAGLSAVLAVRFLGSSVVKDRRACVCLNSDVIGA